MKGWTQKLGQAERSGGDRRPAVGEDVRSSGGQGRANLQQRMLFVDSPLPNPKM